MAGLVGTSLRRLPKRDRLPQQQLTWARYALDTDVNRTGPGRLLCTPTA
jgi:hypothetical protein